MILLSGAGHRQRAEHVVAIFGVGLIGRAIVETLADALAGVPRFLPLSWTDASEQAADLDRLEAEIRSSLGELPRARLTAVWSAGRAGFGASADATGGELQSFRRVLERFERVAGSCPDRQPLFLLCSSAGGLFEGQRLVQADSRPRPLRPYGELKMRQEELLLASSPTISRRIVRLASVFGYVRRCERQGLIPTLVANGIRQRVTSIIGRSTTLRDYVWVEDVADFARDEILSTRRDGDARTSVLASGRPVSLMEVKEIVERTQRRRVYVSYCADPPNEENITFSPSLLPPGWRPNDLALSIRRVHVDALTQGTAFAASA